LSLVINVSASPAQDDGDMTVANTKQTNVKMTEKRVKLTFIDNSLFLNNRNNRYLKLKGLIENVLSIKIELR